MPTDDMRIEGANMPEQEYGYCECCGRTDVPICPRCKNRVPHGYTWGTWLPCHCDGSPWFSPEVAKLFFENIEKETSSK
jgi:hypothetical protein